jgi:hypothetical protein
MTTSWQDFYFLKRSEMLATPKAPRKNEMHCPSTLDPEMHFTPKMKSSDNSKLCFGDSSPSQHGGSDKNLCTGNEATVASVHSENSSLPKCEDGANLVKVGMDQEGRILDEKLDRTPKLSRCRIDTPQIDRKKDVLNHPGNMPVLNHQFILETPPVTPSSEDKERVDGAVPTVMFRNEQQDCVDSQPSEETESIATGEQINGDHVETSEQRVCLADLSEAEGPTAEELNFFRFSFVCSSP